MAGTDRCPDCGSARAAGTPAGLCSKCLLGSVLDAETPPPAGETTAGVLETLAVTAGPIPRVLLRDTDPSHAPGPVLRPCSTETADRAGRIQLLGEIARGGMGAVLKGRDNDLGRDLAVKVLLERHGDNPELLRRFVEEAQIAGQLQHPGVVPVYELGTFADRRPYFAMKLVKGRTLAEVLSDRPDPSADRPRLLSIFLDVAQTMAYAHARGVIHRDLKPSNVMVGSFGEVQVMDWGLAKVLPRGGATDDAGAGKIRAEETVIATARDGSDPELSRAGSVMGTPSYMAPEQARGESVDERADVFAMGSILAEILTGRPAFSGRTSGEIQRKAARGETAEAVGLLAGSGADAELVRLAVDCLAAEPADRPVAAGAVADRVSAYLAGVQARVQAAERDRAVAQAQAVEERRRRKLQAGLAASVLALAAVGGLGAAAYLQQRQARAAAVARALGEAETLLARAGERAEDTARWREAMAAVGRVDLAQAGDPAARARLARIRSEAEAGLRDAERDAALRRALVEIRSNQQDAGPTGTDAAYAGAFRDAGLDLDALGAAETAARLRKRSPAVVVELAAYLDHWSAVRALAGRTAPDRRKPLEVSQSADADPFRDRVRALLASGDRKTRGADLKALTDDPRSGDLAAPTAVLLAGALGDSGDPVAQVALLRKAVARHPDDVWVNFALAEASGQLRPVPREEVVRYYTAARALRPETAHNLAHALQGMGRGEEAEATFRDLIARRPDEAHHLTCFGQLLRDRGRADAAAFDAAILAAREAIARRPGDARARNGLGNALMIQGKADEAIAAHREAIRLQPDLAGAHSNLGNALRGQGKADEAIAAYREAIRLQPDLAVAHSNLGNALLYLKKDPVGAEAPYREAIRLQPDYAPAHNGLGNVLFDLKKDPAGAEAAYREAIRLHPDLAGAHYNLGNALIVQGKVDEAIAAFREAIRLQLYFAPAHNNLGHALMGQGKADEAIAAYRESIRLQPDFALAHINLGNALLSLKKDPAGAEAAYREAIRLEGDRPGDALWALGSLLRQLDRHDEAIATYRRARESGRADPAIVARADREIAATERRRALLGRLDDVLKEADRPREAAELLAFAGIAHERGRHAAAARLFAEAFEADPNLAQDLGKADRYNAACYAALAGSGRGKDDPPPDDPARAGLRRRALDWLRADLALHAAAIDGGTPRGLQAAGRMLAHWKVDADLAGIRDPADLARLPESERDAFRALWAEVDALLDKARASPPKP